MKTSEFRMIDVKNKINNLQHIKTSKDTSKFRMNIHNTSGVMGVTWHKKNKNWRVIIYHSGVPHYFGSYTRKAQAIKVAIRVRRNLKLGRGMKDDR